MAYMRKGLLGPFTGKIGGMIGYFMNGKQCVRKATQKITGPPSMEQTIQREKFSMMTRFLAPLRPFMNEVHKYIYRNENRYYKLFSLNYHEALKGDYPDFFIDFRNVILTTGSLSGIYQTQVSCNKQAALDFHWINNSGDYSHAHHWDSLYLGFYDEYTKCWEFMINVAAREDEFVTIDMGFHRGNCLHVYAGFISEDKRRITNSKYLGAIKIN